MAHLYLMTRGVDRFVKDFFNQLGSLWVPHKWLPPGGKKGVDDKRVTRIHVRPIQIHEIVYPREDRDKVLTTILGKTQPNVTQHKKHNKFIWAIRKALGVKEVGEYDDKVSYPIDKSHIEMIGIGEKDDYEIDGYEQI